MLTDLYQIRKYVDIFRPYMSTYLGQSVHMDLYLFSKLRKGLPGTPSRMRGNIFDKKRKADTLATLIARKEASKQGRLI